MMNQDKKNVSQKTAIKPSTDQRSEEVTDIIERMPVGWTRHVVAIIMLVVLVTVPSRLQRGRHEYQLL